MIEIAANTKAANSNRLSQWLFDPFRFIAGFKALLLGLAIILISVFVGSFSNTHFDGVLDVHTGLKACGGHTPTSFLCAHSRSAAGPSDTELHQSEYGADGEKLHLQIKSKQRMKEVY